MTEKSLPERTNRSSTKVINPDLTLQPSSVKPGAQCVVASLFQEKKKRDGEVELQYRRLSNSSLCISLKHFLKWY